MQYEAAFADVLQLPQPTGWTLARLAAAAEAGMDLAHHIPNLGKGYFIVKLVGAGEPNDGMVTLTFDEFIGSLGMLSIS